MKGGGGVKIILSVSFCNFILSPHFFPAHLNPAWLQRCASFQCSGLPTRRDVSFPRRPQQLRESSDVCIPVAAKA